MRKDGKKAAEIIKELNLDCCVSTFNRWVKKEMPNIEQIDMGKVGALLKAGWDTKKIAIEFRLSEEHTEEIIKRYREEVEQE